MGVQTQGQPVYQYSPEYIERISSTDSFTLGGAAERASELTLVSNNALNRQKYTNLVFGSRFEKFVRIQCAVEKLKKYAYRGKKSHTFRIKLFVFGPEYLAAVQRCRFPHEFQQDTGMNITIMVYQTGGKYTRRAYAEVTVRWP